MPDYRRVFDAAPAAYVVLTPELAIVDANRAYLEATGSTREQLVGTSLFDAFPAPPESADCVRGSLARVLSTREPDTLPLIRYPVRRHAGSEAEDRYWWATSIPLLDDEGEVEFILHHTLDVTTVIDGTAPPAGESTAQRGSASDGINTQLEIERRHMRLMFEQAPGFVGVTHGPDHVLELANKSFYQLVGHRDVLGKPIREALPELGGQGFFELLDEVYRSGEAYVGRGVRVALQTSPGSPHVERHVDFIYQPITAADGSTSGIFIQGHDVSEAYKLAQEITHRTTHDDLTGLVNRREFERRLEPAIQAARNGGPRSTLLFLDLDQFKIVNDVSGHVAGDELLRLLTRVLCEQVRPGDTLARLGGDEFALLLQGCSGPEASRIANELRRLIGDIDFSWGNRVFNCSVSIGAVPFGAESELHDILSAADSACFLAKEKGRNRVHVYRMDDAEISARRQEMDWIGRLRSALQEQRLVLFAQRIAPLGKDHGGKVRRELLLRLRENGELVSPAAFIPAAERYNLMPAIDRHVVCAVLRHLGMLPPDVRRQASFAINISGATFGDHEFLPFVEEQVAAHDVDPRHICFEITETTALANPGQTAMAMTRLKEQGFSFALDDFGSGMASFSYLKQLPVDFLKIDGSFVRNILDDAVDQAIVESVANVAHVMGIKTVAEYVENDEVCRLLASIGIDYAQGFAVHRPEPLIN